MEKEGRGLGYRRRGPSMPSTFSQAIRSWVIGLSAWQMHVGYRRSVGGQISF